MTEEDNSSETTLTAKQRLFVEYYIGETDFNATQAAKMAGYSAQTAYSQGSRLLKNVEVSAAVQSRLRESSMGADEVLWRLSAQGRANLRDFLQIDDGGMARIDLKKAKEGQKLGLLKRYKFSRKNGMEIELHDVQGALEKLGRSRGLFTDKQENRDYDMSIFNEDELERLSAGEPIERVLASVRRRRAGEKAPDPDSADR